MRILICPESIESVQSQVRVNKPALVAANDLSKQCTTNQTNGLTLSPRESTLKPQSTSSPVKESDVTDEMLPAKS